MTPSAGQSVGWVAFGSDPISTDADVRRPVREMTQRTSHAAGLNMGVCRQTAEERELSYA